MARVINSAFTGFVGHAICAQGRMIELRIIKTKLKAKDITPSWEDISSTPEQSEDQQGLACDYWSLQNWPVGLQSSIAA